MIIDKETRTTRLKTLHDEALKRIVIFDGAGGTMVQTYKLTEADFRGERFKDHPRDLRGNNDILALTKPEIIRAIHDGFLEAGADIIETNTFNATSISQADYGMQDLVLEINRTSAAIARAAADEYAAKTPGKPRYVVGSMGPTNRTASLSPDVNNPGFRNVTFDELKDAYAEQARGLLEGGCDLLCVETIFDTLNAKAALFGIAELGDELGFEIPVMISGTITDLSGRNLSGQTMEAFWYSIRHAKPFAVGVNCSFGARDLRPALADIARLADTLVVAFPNAGLPNEMGEYDETPEQTAAFIAEWARDGLVNIVGGCCGTTPAHIKAIAEAVEGIPSRKFPKVDHKMHLAGLEPFTAVA